MLWLGKIGSGAIGAILLTAWVSVADVWTNVPTQTFVMHRTTTGGTGELRLYNGGTAGTRLTVSVVPWLDNSDEVVLIRGSCNGGRYKRVADLKLEPIPTGVDLSGKPIVQPTPLQEVWDYYTLRSIAEMMDHGLSVVAREKSSHQIRWCGDLSTKNEGDPLPTAGY